MKPLAIVGAGMVTGVGFDAPSSCAAIRVGITGFVETRFLFDGEWMLGSPVPLDDGWRGREKLVRMAVLAIREAAAGVALNRFSEIPLLLCLSEPDRPGREAGLNESLLTDVQARLGARFHPHSHVFANGRIAGVLALDYARRLIADGRSHCIIAGADSLLHPGTLRALVHQRRVQTEANSDGFIPGEAAAAVLVAGPGGADADSYLCQGIGYGAEPAPAGSEQPLRADGMVEAIRAALAEAGTTLGTMDYRLTDLAGDQYGFKEASLALSRVLRERIPAFELWHPVDCIGEVGAAIVPCVLAVALVAMRKGYAPGPRVLCHFANYGHERAALVLAPGDGRVLRG